MADELWIVIPAYNEAAVIERTLADLEAYLPRIVVIDDGSSDDTAACALRAGATVVRHAINIGQGAALQTGITFTLAQRATHICTFDADGQHDADTVGLMLKATHAADADVVLCSRFSGGAIDMPSAKRGLLKLAIGLTRAQTRLPLTDAHNGLRLFTRNAAERIKIDQPRMAHASEIVTSVARQGLRVVEVPTTVRYTAYSRAKGQKLSNSIKIVADLAYAAFSK